MDNKITLDFTKLIVVPIEQVHANTWNPKDKDTKQYQDVKASIIENGMRGFIVVREREDLIGEDGLMQYEIIDGEQRFTACSELEFDKVPIYNEGLVADKRAKELTLWWQTQVDFNELSLAKLVTSMIEQYGEITSPYTEKKIAELQELAKFSFDSYQKTDTTPPKMPEGELLKTLSFQVTTSQHDIIQAALSKVRKAYTGELDIMDGKAFELICAEYLNAPEGSIA
jgi:hypothetical protein